MPNFTALIKKVQGDTTKHTRRQQVPQMHSSRQILPTELISSAARDHQSLRSVNTMQQCSMQYCLHGAFTPQGALDFAQTRGQYSYGCNTVSTWQSVLVYPWSGEVCMMTEVEKDVLLTYHSMCNKKTQKK